MSVKHTLAALRHAVYKLLQKLHRDALGDGLLQLLHCAAVERLDALPLAS